MPNAYKDEPAMLSERDLEHIAFAAGNRADYISVPFVRSAADMRQVRTQHSVSLGVGGSWECCVDR